MEAGPKATAIAGWNDGAVAIIGALGGGVLTAWVPFVKSSWPQSAKHIPSPVPAIGAYLTVVAVASVWMLYRGCRLRVRLDDHGVTIRRLFKVERRSSARAHRIGSIYVHKPRSAGRS